MKNKNLDLNNYFPFYLGTIANKWATTSSKLYLAEYGIGISEWRVLASIFSLGEASSLDVVNLISMDAGAVSRAVSRLESKGYITPVEGRFRGRTKPYMLAESGNRVYDAISETALKREKFLLSDLTKREQKELIEMMKKIMGKIDQL